MMNVTPLMQAATCATATLAKRLDGTESSAWHSD